MGRISNCWIICTHVQIKDRNIYPNQQETGLCRYGVYAWRGDDTCESSPEFQTFREPVQEYTSYLLLFHIPRGSDEAEYHIKVAFFLNLNWVSGRTTAARSLLNFRKVRNLKLGQVNQGQEWFIPERKCQENIFLESAKLC